MAQCAVKNVCFAKAPVVARSNKNGRVAARAAPAKAAAAKLASASFTRVQQKSVMARSAPRAAVLATKAGDFDKDTVSVVPGEGGLEKIVMKGADGSVAEAYTFGGVVTSWVKDGRDVLYVRPDAKFDKSKPISGGIPHCWPQFGPGDLQVHGFARNVDWELTSTTGGDKPSITMTLTPSEYTKAMWDYEFKAEQTITLADGKLTATLAVTNTGDKEFDFTSSFHTYFSVESLPDVAVDGLSGLKVLDRVADKEGTQDGSVTIGSEVDSVYYSSPSDITLKVGGGKEVGIASAGWTDAVVWNPWTGMEACYQEFVCVENAVVADPVVLGAGASWSGSMTLSA